MGRYTCWLSLINRGVRHWKQNGTASTLNEVRHKLLMSQYQDSLSNRIMNQDSLLETATSTGDVWFDKKEAQFTISDPPEEFGFGETDDLTGQYKPDRRYLCELPNCHLIGPSAVGIWDEERIILDTASGNLKKFQHRFSDFFPVELCQSITFGSLNKQTTQSLSGPVLPLVPYQNKYYYHWLLEQLPKLQLLERYMEETEKTPSLLIPSDPPSFVTESLELLGYLPEQLIEWSGGLVATESLLITNHRSQSPHGEYYTPSRKDYEWVRNRYVDQIEKIYDKLRSRRTYISRQEATRGVINFDEFSDWLQNNQFSIDIFENNHFLHQVRMANQSDIIMGVSGAGMTNILFADDPLVVQLTPDYDVAPPFYLLSEVLGQEFRSCVCSANADRNLYVVMDELKIETLSS